MIRLDRSKIADVAAKFTLAIFLCVSLRVVFVICAELFQTASCIDLCIVILHLATLCSAQRLISNLKSSTDLVAAMLRFGLVLLFASVGAAEEVCEGECPVPLSATESLDAHFPSKSSSFDQQDAPSSPSSPSSSDLVVALQVARKKSVKP